MYLRLDDINMYYEDNQKQDCPVIVFIHGLGENADSWQNQLEFFADKPYRTIAFDLRGHGRTDDGEKEISIFQFAQDIFELTKILNLEAVNFVGLSMGGIVAQQLAISFPKIVHSLCLCNTACYASSEAKQKLADRIKMINENDMDFIANFIVTACLPEIYDQKVYDTAFNIFRKNRKNPYIQATKATFSIDFREQLSQIKVPTLVLTGEFDKATPVEASNLIHSLISHSEMKIIKGVGHLSKLENPARFNLIILEFIEENC